MRDPMRALIFSKKGLRFRMTQRSIFEPGMIVRHPLEENWGLGQVQSAVGGKVTVNFQHVGKVVIDQNRINLTIVSFS